MKTEFSKLIKVGGRRKIDQSNILMLKADSNYTYIYLKDGTKFLVSYNLQKIAERLTNTSGFIRPNRSLLFNALYISSFDENLLQLSLPDGQPMCQATISRRKLGVIQQQWKSLHF